MCRRPQSLCIFCSIGPIHGERVAPHQFPVTDVGKLLPVGLDAGSFLQMLDRLITNNNKEYNSDARTFRVCFNQCERMTARSTCIWRAMKLLKVK